MDMEEKPEEFTCSNDNHHHHAHILIKGKRTKRQRPASPISIPALTTSSSSSGGAGVGGGDNCSIPSPMASGYETHESTTEEEEDMANCLILLAQSGSGGGGCSSGRRKEGCGKGSEKPNTRKITDKAVAGLYGYECNTCNRTFPSFQALGGHRASHKRPKTAMVESKKPPVTPPPEYHDHYYDDQFNKITTTTTTTLFLLHGTTNHTKSSSKVHECSICGSDFSSGQALGGHMRRHRTLTSAQITTMDMDAVANEHQTHKAQKRRNYLPLDLNLPAPDDDQDPTKFPFTAASKQSSLVFSSPALVDCHN